MRPKQRILSAPVYQPGKPIDDVKREFGLTEVIKLASNENPYGCSPKAKEAIAAQLDSLALYPDGASLQLRWDLADFLGVKPEQLMFGNGSDEIVLMISRAYLEPGTNTVMATPTFSQYRSNAMVEGAELIEVPLKDGVHDLEAMASAINGQTRVVWVCNPNNPSGTIVGTSELEAFLKKVPKDVLVVMDEAYYEYVVDEAYPQTIPMLAQYPNLIILRTFSKIYGLATLRVGYGIASEEIISHLDHVREPFNTSSLGQAAARAALKDQEFVKECSRRNREGLKQLTDRFDEWGLSYYPSQTNFVLVNLNLDSDEVFKQLLQQGIIVRSGKALGFPGYQRITVGTAEQNEKVLQALANIVVGAGK
ncbi:MULTISPECIES: histidinol-phosphate transaminase [Brevibacillus]|jgi:histidinol-phosphate aminotransferase|uniref:Histidinol-phosphate aminotransferase n=1 Tax=Brevibacillus borstelensis AK1 TaxID=1300222 RepID=M8EDN2_9BACL|nr:histidinol-phosphate transaminase [Brevibacillus borstelensis]EMT53580.1 histidinol-phosphate aminotransferase [Brevibacillus borstelensis AK1]KKX53041.1 histidinol-phosphate aminotransferase [Brevibacillus borstelensis cifa_chp40]MBE5397812.1 histidinol-phosphate transaminase [Brevibacillus borstelensis]MCM3469474.1 histidinol-phosphate transaminase [Brevibacillus borstelensis]MCM3557359.1 histidinol-phosphate transaminase [Brevibacillus borstelensis]